MLEIILFAIGIMYTPGPVNLLSLNNGLQKDLTSHTPFSLGVAGALWISFTLFGFAGSAFFSEAMLPYIGTLGCGFILYLAYKVISSPVDIESRNSPSILTFKHGLFMQLLNPKSYMVVLPVATVQFPAAGIQGMNILVWSTLLGLLGFGAPMVYAAAGAIAGRRITRPAYFRLLNTAMGVLLVFVALDMAYEQVFLRIAG